MIVEHKGKRGSSFYVRVNGPDGNRFYGEPIRSWEYPSKTHAKRVAQKREADILTGRAFVRAMPTVDAYVERFLKRLEQEPTKAGSMRKRSTLRTQRYSLVHFEQAFKGRRLDRITRPEAIDWAAGASGTELKVVRQLFNAAVDEELLDRNPFRGLSKPVGSRGDQAPPTVEEFDRLLDACSALGDYGPTFRAFVAFAGYSGLRPGELFALEWDDIDFDRMRISVQRNLSNGVVTLPKSNKTREAVLTPPARDALLTLQRVSELVFVNKRRGRLSGPTCHNYWSIVRAAAGLDVTLYLATRHRLAHHLYVERQLPWNVVRQQLGQADESLEKVYGHGDQGWMHALEASYGMNVRHLEAVNERKVNEN